MIVRQAANVLELLEYFARRKRPATLAEVSEELDWPRSSAFNILTTLADKGYLYEPRMRGGFYPTPRWLNLSQAVADAEPVPPAISGIVTQVAEATGETTGVCAPSRVSAVFLHVVESREPIRYVVEVGERMPLQATATGRALLSLCSLEERQAIYRKVQFEKFASKTLMTEAEVESELRRSVKKGWFKSAADYHQDLCGAAVPLPYNDNRYAIVVGGPNFRCLDRIEEFANVITRSIKRARL